MNLIDCILFALFNQYGIMLAEHNILKQNHRANRILVLCHRLCKNHPEFAPLWEMFMSGANLVSRGDRACIELIDISLQIMNLQQYMKKIAEDERRRIAACN